MSVTKKTFITAFLAIVVVGAVALQMTNTGLFQGRLVENAGTEAGDELTPDLTISLSAIAPSIDEGDVGAQVTITNNGPGRISGETPFTYSVMLGDVEVFSNTDSYSFMDAGDSFSFTYPISRLIYQYDDEGTITAHVDTDGKIDELSEDNNSASVDYFL